MSRWRTFTFLGLDVPGVPTPALSRLQLIAIFVGYLLFFLYSVLVFSQVLLGLFLPALLLALAYVGWRAWRLFELYESRLETKADSSNETDETDPIEALKRQYAAGELTDSEFEAELERRLEGEQGSPPTSVGDTASRDDGSRELTEETSRDGSS